MSTEIINHGNDFVIKQLDASYGGRQIEAFKIDGGTGLATFKGVSMDAKLTTAAASATAAAASATAAAGSATTAAANVAAIPGTPTLSVAAQSSTHIDVTIQLKDAGGSALATKAEATVWLSDTAGAAPGTAPSGAVTIQTGTLLKEDTTKILHRVVSDSSGVIVIRIIGTALATCYVNAAIGNKSASSAAVTFA